MVREAGPNWLEVTLGVADSGPGIAREAQRHVLRAFTTGDALPQEDRIGGTKSTGIGLRLAGEIVCSACVFPIGMWAAFVVLCFSFLDLSLTHHFAPNRLDRTYNHRTIVKGESTYISESLEILVRPFAFVRPGITLVEMRWAMLL